MNNLWTIIYSYHNEPIHYDHIKKSNPSNQIIVNKHKDPGWDYNRIWRNSDALIREWLKEHITTIKHNNIAVIEWDALITASLPDFQVDGLMANTVHNPKNSNWYWFKEINLLGKFKNFAMGVSPLGVLFMDRKFVNDWLSDEFDEIYSKDINSELRIPTIAAFKNHKISALNIPSITYNTQREQKFIYANPGIHHPVKNKLLDKLLIIVPYRDRENHLKQFVPHIYSTLNKQNIKFKLVIVEQDYKKLFNRGLLCNVGFQLFNDEYNYVCIHDVDMIGENFDYSYEPIVTHLSAKQESNGYQEWYERYLGGTVLFPTKQFKLINGFSNKYWGWGSEDDDLRLRCDFMNLKVQRKLCKYRQLRHEPSTRPKSPNVQLLRSMWKEMTKEKIYSDGITNCLNLCDIKNIQETDQYTLVQIQTKDYE